MAGRYGIAGLTSLPPELIRMVRDASESGTFWRYISALGLGMELSRTNPEGMTAPPQILSIPMRDISAWTRGTGPSLIQSQDGPPIVRLSFDSRGISRIERLPGRPSFAPRRSNNTAYAILDESHLGSLKALFKVCSWPHGGDECLTESNSLCDSITWHASNCGRNCDVSTCGTFRTLLPWKIANFPGVWFGPHDSGLSTSATLLASPSSSLFTASTRSMLIRRRHQIRRERFNHCPNVVEQMWFGCISPYHEAKKSLLSVCD